MSISSAQSMNTMRVYLLAVQQAQLSTRERPPTVVNSELDRAAADLAQRQASQPNAMACEGIDDYA